MVDPWNVLRKRIRIQLRQGVGGEQVEAKPNVAPKIRICLRSKNYWSDNRADDDERNRGSGADPTVRQSRWSFDTGRACRLSAPAETARLWPRSETIRRSPCAVAPVTLRILPIHRRQ